MTTYHQHKRHLSKMLSWRLLSSMATFSLSLWITGGIQTSSLITSYEFITKNILYYGHEAFWSHVSWGMQQTKAKSKRHLCKGITWRILASTTTFLITWLVTQNATVGLSIASYEAIFKVLLYYGHEAIWNKVPLKTVQPASSMQ